MPMVRDRYVDTMAMDETFCNFLIVVLAEALQAEKAHFYPDCVAIPESIKTDSLYDGTSSS